MELFLSQYQNILFNTARIFSSVFEIVLAYILVNNFYTFRFQKKRFDFLPFVALAGGMILLQEQANLQAAYGYAVACAALTAILFALYSDPPKRKLLGAMIFAVLIAVSEIAASLLFSLFARRFEIAAEESYMLLARSGLANLIMILLAALISAFSKHLFNC